MAILTMWIIDIAKRRRQFPRKIIDRESEYQISSASLDDLNWIARLEKATYKPTDAAPLEKLKEWYLANHSGFFVILEDGKRIGHIDILPVKKNDQMFDKFFEGVVREIKISGASIATPEEKGNVEKIYVESVIINPKCPSIIKYIFSPFSTEKPRRRGHQAPIKYLLSNLVPIISNITDSNSVKYVYAMAATRHGRHVLTSLGFDIETPASYREDGHDLFRASLPVLTERIGGLLKYTVIKRRKEFEAILQKGGVKGL